MFRIRGFRAVLAALSLSFVALPLTACGGGDDGETLTVYSGRTEELIGPVIERFEEESGIDVRVLYGGTPELAATIAEEGDNSPADVYIAQDAGSLGLLADEGLLDELPGDILDLVPEAYRSPRGDWVGVSGRARVVVYNTDAIDPEELPDSILDYADPEWEGRIGWAPTNGSFQSFVTALRVVEGEDVARQWLEGIVANDPAVFENNTAVVQAVANGEVEVGFVNHYYLFRFLAEQGEGFGARNYFFTNGDVGGLINVAGAAVLASSDQENDAHDLLEFLLNEESQEYFANETYEYPLAHGVQPSVEVPDIASLQPVNIDLSDLHDVRGTIDLLQETGALP